MIMRLKLVGAVVLAGCAVAGAREPARSAPHAWVEQLNAWLGPGDTVRYVVRWTAPAVDSVRQLPLASYRIRLLRNTDTVQSHQLAASRTVDTLYVAAPAVGDSLGPLRVVLYAVDTRGTTSAPAVTGAWYLKRGPLAPGVPIITVDTIRLAGLTAVDVRPILVALTPGATVQVCAFGTLRDGTRGILVAAGDSIPVPCVSHFHAWLAETGERVNNN